MLMDRELVQASGLPASLIGSEEMLDDIRTPPGLLFWSVPTPRFCTFEVFPSSGVLILFWGAA